MRAVEERDLEALGEREQPLLGFGDEVDDVERDGLVGGRGDRVAHGVLGPVGVAPAQLGYAAREGDGVVRDLAAERPLEVLAGEGDRRGGADRGVGRHRGDVAGHRDERAGRGRLGARRADVGDDGHLGALDAADDLPHRADRAAGRVDAQQHGGGVGVLGVVDRAVDVALEDRVDLAVDGDDVQGVAGVVDAARGADGGERDQQRPERATDRGSGPRGHGSPSRSTVSRDAVD